MNRHEPGLTSGHENPLPLVPSRKGRGNQEESRNDIPPLTGGGQGEGEQRVFSSEKGSCFIKRRD